VAWKQYKRVLLRATVALAAITVAVRACLQAITIDEAVSYLNFARLPGAAHWQAHSNNHVLNSLPMWLFTSLFGASHLTVRGGAVIGAAIFIYVAYRLAKLMAGESILGWALFTCFVFNPFILDFLVAARGYGLALAFLALAVAIAFGAVGRSWELTAGEEAGRGAGRGPGGPPYRECSLVSLCLALSFSANFAFAVVDAAASLTLFLWLANAPAFSKLPRRARTGARARLLAMAVLPGLLVAGLIVGSTLRDWRKVQLVYGAGSLREMFGSLYEASFYQVNPNLIGPIYGLARRNAHHILPLLAIFCLWRVAAILKERGAAGGRQGRRPITIALAAASIAAMALIGHEILFHAFGVLLPMDRTGIYLVFLLTLAAGALASIPLDSMNGRLSGRALTAMLFTAAVYFLCCYRIGYFKEWAFDRDVDRVYSVLAYYNRTCGIDDVAVNWRYDAPLNYYRTVSGRETLAEFTENDGSYPDGRRAYVLNDWDDWAYAQANRLTLAWRSPSGVMVALNSALDGGHPCEVPPPASAP
jgi:hypothetical protein